SKRDWSSDGALPISVLGDRSNDVIPFLPVAFSNALDRQVVAFCRPGSKDNLVSTCANEAADPLARQLHRGFRIPPKPVTAACGIPKLLPEVRQHSLQDFRINGSGSVVIHEDRESWF